jgi:hypothetical protein
MRYMKLCLSAGFTLLVKLVRVPGGGKWREEEEKPAGEERKRRRPVGSKNTKKPCSEKVEGGELAGCADMGGLQFFTTQIESRTAKTRYSFPKFFAFIFARSSVQGWSALQTLK